MSSIIQNKFVRNVAIVASGAAGSQAIGILLSPIITRLYGPQPLGILGAFMAITALMTSIASFSYPVAIVLPRNDEEARGITVLSGYLVFGFSLIITIVFMVSGEYFVKILHLEEISSFIFLIPVAVIFSVGRQISQQWFIRRKLYEIRARLEVLHALIVNIIKVGLGMFVPVAGALVLIFTFGNALFSYMLFSSIKLVKKNVPQQPSTNNSVTLWKTARKYYDFPLYRTPAGFVDAFSQNLPVIMLAGFFGPASAGFYALCKKVLDQPTKLISKSVGDVFYPKLAEAANENKNLPNQIVKATLALAVVGVVPFTLVFIFGPNIFELIFGEEWGIAGEYAQRLSFLMFVQFINKPSVVALPVLRLQLFQLYYSIITAFLRAGALFVGFYFYKSDLIAISLYSIVGIFMYLVLIFFVIFQSKRRKQGEIII